MKRIILAAGMLYLLLPFNSVAQDIDGLIEELGIRESSIPSREMGGWKRPEQVAIRAWSELPETGPGSKQWFRDAADGIPVEFVSGSQSIDETFFAGVDVYLGGCNATVIDVAASLRYMHNFSAGMDRCMSIPAFSDSGLIVTNSAKAASETIGEHTIAMLLMLSRDLNIYYDAQKSGKWLNWGEDAPSSISLKGKTMLVLGLGGIGSQTARRAHDLGMRVIGTRNSSRDGPDYVEYVGLSDETNELAARANVVVNALPLTENTRGVIDADFFAQLPEGSYYLSVGRGATTDTDALIAALKGGRLAGAGLDVTDPEPLPADHELWTLPNVIITPHTSSDSDLSSQNTINIARENLRRYVNGDKLLNLVDIKRGY